MALELKMDTGKIKRDSKLYLIIGVIFIVMSYFFYTSGGKYYTSISKILKDTKETKTDIESLEAKISSLKSIKDNSVTDLNALNISFQPEDPSLFMYSQLKALSFNNNVELVGTAFSEGTAIGDISVAVISFKIRGIKEGVINFITDLGKTAPLSGLGGMTFSKYAGTGDAFELDMSVNIYYSPLPKALPDTEKVVNSLTPEEEATYASLTDLKVLSKADFKAQEPINNNIEDPFGVPVIVEERVSE